MIVQFEVRIVPPSQNKMRYKSYAIRKEVKVKSELFQSVIRDNFEFQRLKSTFNPEKECLEIVIRYRGPHLNKKGLPSSKSVDITNFEKWIIDEITLPSKSDSLQVDDKCVFLLHSMKELASEPSLFIEIRNHALPSN